MGGEVFLSVATLVLVDDRCTCFGLAVGTLPHPHAKKGGGPAGGMLVFFEHLGFRGMSTRGVMMFSRWPCWISTSANGCFNQPKTECATKGSTLNDRRALMLVFIVLFIISIA